MQTPTFEAPNVNARANAIRAMIEGAGPDFLVSVYAADAKLIVEAFGRDAYAPEMLSVIDAHIERVWPWERIYLPDAVIRALIAPPYAVEAAQSA